MKTNIQNITFTALMTAVLCILGPVVLPIGPVPMSFANLVIYLTVILLDKKRATSCVAVYLLIGMLGIPVFAGFTGGVGKILGPTGGYLIGYPVLSWIAGVILEKRSKKLSRYEGKIGKEAKAKIEKKKEWEMFYQGVALATGTLVTYVLGTLWLMYQSNISFQASLGIGVFPFLVFDILKIVVAVSLGNAIKVRLKYI